MADDASSSPMPAPGCSPILLSNTFTSENPAARRQADMYRFVLAKFLSLPRDENFMQTLELNSKNVSPAAARPPIDPPTTTTRASATAADACGRIRDGSRSKISCAEELAYDASIADAEPGTLLRSPCRALRLCFVRPADGSSVHLRTSLLLSMSLFACVLATATRRMCGDSEFTRSCTLWSLRRKMLLIPRRRTSRIRPAAGW